ncbi:phosphatidate cytidylyltransferase [Elusimicrobiota bacterium]
MERHRILSAVIMIPITFLFIKWGGFAFFILIAGLVISSLLEFSGMCKMNKLSFNSWWGILIGTMFMLNAYLVSKGQHLGWQRDFSALIITVMIIGIMVTQLFRRDIKTGLINAGITVFSIFYIVWLTSHAIFLREIKPFGYQFMLVAVICTWLSDVGAYYSGKNFGIARRLHIVSPNKSRAGGLGAVLMGACSMLAMKYLLKLYFLSVSHAVILGALIGIFAVVGDLVESMLKRSLGQKDSGKFLPGHGGVLDRIDSLMFTIPLVYYYVKLVVL